MLEPATVAVTPSGGALSGIWRGDVARFAGIPYAQAPTGALRWAPPRPLARHDGTRPALAPGPVAPQTGSRLDAVTGPMRAPEPDEDCLSLTVWTPAPGPAEALPVLVFLHGGAFLSGAGSAAWYDGETMARRGRVVVVAVNYRLGALGWLYLPESLTGEPSSANLGLQDQRLALCWVAGNIAAFGGDPGNVTVFGESAGASSIVALGTMRDTAGLFGRGILESAPLGMPASSAADAERITRAFLAAAGVDGRLDALRALPVARILDAQRSVVRDGAGAGAIVPPFVYVLDGDTLAREPVTAANAGALDELELLVGVTRDEAAAFFRVDPSLEGLDAARLVAHVREGRGDAYAEALRAYLADDDGDRDPIASLCRLGTDELFAGPSFGYAEGRARRGRPIRTFRFDWSSDALDGRLGACHTIELPFVFDNPDGWTGAPMLGSTTPAQLTALGDRVQDAWLAFARTGDPSHPGLPRWDRFGVDGGATMALRSEPALERLRDGGPAS